jgi:hypothetical protein
MIVTTLYTEFHLKNNIQATNATSVLKESATSFSGFLLLELIKNIIEIIIILQQGCHNWNIEPTFYLFTQP